MKTKRSDIPPKMVALVVGFILVCIIALWLVTYVKEKKEDLNSADTKSDKAIASMADFDLLAYNGASIRGDALVDLIDEMNDNKAELSIGVKTTAVTTATYYNYTYSSTGNTLTASTTYSAPSKADTTYINLTANFLGDVIRNSNNEIVGITFTQQ